MAANALSIAPRYQRPQGFGGTDVAWRVLCDLYPAAETPDVVMAVVEYCTARKLDPLRRPVHVVPMYNARLRRKVQTVMQGINELETTAHRTGLWCGMELPQWGPDETRTFKGEYENDDGSKRQVEVTVTFPVWCAVKVWRMVKGKERPFAEQVFWIEAYGRAGFRSEVPNARWTQAPRQMLHKCAKAASLRAAFPEEVGEYAAEEMEGHTVDDHAGPTIDHVDEQAPSGPADEGGLALRLLDGETGDRWYKALRGLLAAARSISEIHEVRAHRSVMAALAPDARTPTMMRRQIEDYFREAFERLAPSGDDGGGGGGSDAPDPIANLIAEVDAIPNAPALDRLLTNADWRSRVRAAVGDFPPDEDRINEAIAARRATLAQTKGR